jgi:hypothetical protein
MVPDNAEFRSRRVLLKSPSGEREVQRFADELGWPRLLEQEEDAEQNLSREVAWAAGPALSLHFVQDPVSGHGYVVAWGRDKGAVDGLAELAAHRLDTWTPPELLAGPERATDDRERAIAFIRAGVGAPDEFDKRFFDLIVKGITDRSSMAREAAIVSTVYSQYPQYRPVLKRAAESDPDPARRRDAEVMLRSFDAEGVGSP